MYVMPPCRRQNAPNGLIGDSIASCHLPQRFALGHALDDARPLGTWHLEGWRRWVAMLVLRWYNFYSIHKQHRSRYPGYWRQRTRLPSVPPPTCLNSDATRPRALIANSRGFHPHPPLFPLKGLSPGGTRGGARSRIRPHRFHSQVTSARCLALRLAEILLGHLFPLVAAPLHHHSMNKAPL